MELCRKPLGRLWLCMLKKLLFFLFEVTEVKFFLLSHISNIANLNGKIAFSSFFIIFSRSRFVLYNLLFHVFFHMQFLMRVWYDSFFLIYFSYQHGFSNMFMSYWKNWIIQRFRGKLSVSLAENYFDWEPVFLYISTKLQLNSMTDLHSRGSKSLSYDSFL